MSKDWRKTIPSLPSWYPARYDLMIQKIAEQSTQQDYFPEKVCSVGPYGLLSLITFAIEDEYVTTQVYINVC
jgi:hypothetical protein